MNHDWKTKSVCLRSSFIFQRSGEHLDIRVIQADYLPTCFGSPHARRVVVRRAAGVRREEQKRERAENHGQDEADESFTHGYVPLD